MELTQCPNCKSVSSNANQEAYWELVKNYERLAKEHQSEQDLVYLAKLVIDKVVTDVSRGSQSGALAYDEHHQHVYQARNLLTLCAHIIDERKNV